MVSWFNETSGGISKGMSFRFRGQESFAFLKSFPLLISRFLPLFKNEENQKRLLGYFYIMIHIRKLISFSVRLNDFSPSDLEEMMVCGKKLFKACCLLETTTTPSMWVLCNVAPVHAKETLSIKFQ